MPSPKSKEKNKEPAGEFDGSTASRAVKSGVTLSLLQATGADKRLAADKECEDGLRARGRKRDQAV